MSETPSEGAVKAAEEWVRKEQTYECLSEHTKGWVNMGRLARLVALLLDSFAAQGRKVCVLTQLASGLWRTGCDSSFADSPTDSAFTYCCRCGGQVEAKAYEEGREGA